MSLDRLFFLVIAGCLLTWWYTTYEPQITGQVEQVQNVRFSVFAMAEKHFFASEYDAAVSAYRKALDQGLEEPKRKQAYFRISSALDKAKDRHEAIVAYEEAIRLYPDSEEALRGQKTLDRLRLEVGQ